LWSKFEAEGSEWSNLLRKRINGTKACVKRVGDEVADTVEQRSAIRQDCSFPICSFNIFKEGVIHYFGGFTVIGLQRGV
jgi:hypothetical protein